MIQTLITDTSIIKENFFNKVENITIIDPLETLRAIKQIKALPQGPIEIYDYTLSLKHRSREIIKVSDHINMTGNNPLIGNQKELPKQFVDISNLYNSESGVTTTCLGKYFNQNKQSYQYPSAYLCYIAIIVRALERKNIHAFLINMKDEKRDD